MCAFAAALSGEGPRPPDRLSVPYLERPSPVDGNLSAWSGVPKAPFRVGATEATARFAWDESAFRALVEVGDATPLAAGASDEDPELGGKSDSVEFFLDVHGEAAARMDTNDYQVTVARDGRRTTFKGSAALSGTLRPEPEADEAAQPKDWGMNLPVEVAVAEGPEAGPGRTPGYRVEIAIPWAAVGGRPAAGKTLGISSAVNDLTPPHEGETSPRRTSSDFRGRAEFESPAVWAAATLAPPGVLVRVAREARAWVVVAFVLAAAIAAVGWRFLRRPARPAAAAPPVLPPGEAPATGDDPVERLRRDLPARLREDLTAETLAEIAGVSLRTLQRIFRERFDTSPMTWLMEARLLEAARLIRAGDDPVTKIAYRVGFKDPSHFTRRFKARFGVSPNEYRRSDAAPLQAAASSGRE